QPGVATKPAAADPTGVTAEERRTPAVVTSAPGGVARADVEHRRAASPATSQGQGSAQNPQPFAEWRALFANLGKLIRGREEPPAPVEERSIDSSAPQMAMPRSPARQPPNLLSQASPRPSESPRVAPGLIPTVPLRTEASPSAVPAPLATPTLIAEARAQVTGSPAPAPASPATVESVASPPERSQEALAIQARRM